MTSATKALSMLDQLKETPLNNTVSNDSLPPENKNNSEGALIRWVSSELQQMVLTVLKLDSKDFSDTTPLLDYGLDSVASTEIGNLFESQFDIVIPPTVFFEFQDLKGFAGYLVTNHAEELHAKYREFKPDQATTKGISFSNETEEVQLIASNEQKQDKPIRQMNPNNMSVETSTQLSIEDLWENSQTTNTSLHSEGVQGFSSNTQELESTLENSVIDKLVQEPSRETLNSFQQYVDRAHIVTIARSNAPDLECAIYGNGPPLLMLGGLLMHFSAMWKVQLKELGEHYRLIMFHMPGSGNVDLYEEMSLESLAQDVASALDALGIVNPVPVLGCSFGGVLAQAFCLAYPNRCSSLALVVSTPFSEGATNFPALMRELQTSARFMEVNCNWPMASLPEYQRVIKDFDFRDQLKTLGMPTLVIAGGQDKYTTPAYSRMIYDCIPSAQWLEIPDAGHLLPFTHYEKFNSILLDFLGTVVSTDIKPEQQTHPTYLPSSQKTLNALEEYVSSGEQGHCVILSASQAQTALLLDALCNEHKARLAIYRSYFLTSLEEAFDAALRLVRHVARNKNPESSGTVLVVDDSARWLDYFDPLRRGHKEALVPNILIVENLKQAEALLQDGDDIIALAWVGNKGQQLEDIECFMALADDSDQVSILVEIDNPACEITDWLSCTITQHPDLVVFGECISGFQSPIAACLVHESIANPWLMTPNEGYVRQPMANFGFTMKLAYEYLLDHLDGIVTPEQQHELRRISADPEEAYKAHLTYGNSGYAKVARLHGFDSRFYEARGLRSRLVRHGQASREIIDCLSNVGSCPRGLNPLDVIDNVARIHDPEYDYWFDLGVFLNQKTGFEHAFPTSSQTTALEAALTLGLMAASNRTKLLCFTGGSGFSMLSSISSLDVIFDFFRKPFQPVYPHVIFIDPSDEGASEQLRKELLSGEIAMVWFETIQVEGNCVRSIPHHLIELINRYRTEGNYLIGIDETQTNLWTGELLHSRNIVPSPDIVALGTGLCDSLLPMGAVLSKHKVIDNARRTNSVRMDKLEQRSVCQLSAHIALNSLRQIYKTGLLAEVCQKGKYFKQALTELATEFPLLSDVRGEGLLLAIEFELSEFEPFIQRSFGYFLWGAMLRDPVLGVALVVCPIHNHSLRIVPPLNISYEEINLIVENLRRRLHEGVEQVMRDCVAYCTELGDERTADFLSGLKF